MTTRLFTLLVTALCLTIAPTRSTLARQTLAPPSPAAPASTAGAESSSATDANLAADDFRWDPRFNAGINGDVNAVVTDADGNIYIGGTFTEVGGVAASRVAMWDGAKWKALGSGVSSTVYALALSPTGELFAGGAFSTAGGVSAPRVARWNGSAWSALGGTGAPTGGFAYALAFEADGDLWVGGTLTVSLPLPATHYLLRWSGGGWVAAPTDPFNGIVYALAVGGDGKVYAGGAFSGSGGRQRIAVLSGGTWSALGSGLTLPVRALAIAVDGDLYVGGEFVVTVSGLPVNHVARWNGTAWSNMQGPGSGGIGFSNRVFALAVSPDGRVFAGGVFSSPAFVAALVNNRWSSLTDGGTNDVVLALTVNRDNQLIAGGEFTFAGGRPASHAASWRLDAEPGWQALGDGVTDAAGSGVNAGIYKLAESRNGTVYAGGVFERAGGATANNIARWYSGDWQPLTDAGGGNGTNGAVNAVVVRGATVYACGEFTQAGSAAGSASVARWTAAGGWAQLAGGPGNTCVDVAVDSGGQVFAAVTRKSGLPPVLQGSVFRWNGTVWTQLGTWFDGGVGGLAVSSTDGVYAAFNASLIGGRRVVTWNGTAWVNVGGTMNNAIRDLAVDRVDTLFAAGSFTTAGGVTVNRVARWDSVGGAWVALGSGANDTVEALDADAAGQLYAVGAFSAIGGRSAAGVGRWDGRAWAGYASGVDGLEFDVLAGPRGELLVAGDFELAGETEANNIARWPFGPPQPTWQALGSGANGAVNAMLRSGSSIYIGGEFSTAGSTAANHIARWTGSTWQALGSGMDGPVHALALNAQGQLIAGGTFSSAGGAPAGNIARWTGSQWQTLGIGVNGMVSALAVDGAGNLYAAGTFSKAGGVDAVNIARWDGTAWSALGSGLSPSGTGVTALAIGPDGSIYAGGWFSYADGAPACLVARWDGAAWHAMGDGPGECPPYVEGGSPPPPPPLPSGFVRALHVDAAGTLYAGGWFGGNEPPLKRWSGSAWVAVDPTLAGQGNWVSTITTDSAGRLYIAGSFAPSENVQQYPFQRVVAMAWDGSDWDLLGSDSAGSVNDFVWDASGALYTGGRFSNVGSTLAANVARLSRPRWQALALNNGLNGTVRALALGRDGAWVFAGGEFTTAGGVAASRLALWDGNQWQALGSGVDATVHALAWDALREVLYVAGEFTTAGGVAASRVARWSPSTGWSALGGGTNGPVYALSLEKDGTLYAGGSFTQAGTVAAFKVAGFNIKNSSWFALEGGVDSPANASVRAMAIDEGGSERDPSLFIGGDFTSVDGDGDVKKVARYRDFDDWLEMPGGFDACNAVLALAVHSEGDAYASGSCGLSEIPFGPIARWSGSGWTSLGDADQVVNALAGGFDNQALYAAGSFSEVGWDSDSYVNAARIARWADSEWTALGSGLNASAYASVVDAYNNVWVGGAFTTAGGRSSLRIGRYQDEAVGSDVVAVSLEVTQGLQNLANAMPLVAGRETWVRAYVRSAAGDAPNVNAELRAYVAGTDIHLPGSPRQPENGTVTVSSDGSNRLGFNDSFLFYIPENWRHGSVDFVVVVNPNFDQPFEPPGQLRQNNYAESRATFLNAEPLKLMFVETTFPLNGDPNNGFNWYDVPQDPSFPLVLEDFKRYLPIDESAVDWDVADTSIGDTPFWCEDSSGDTVWCNLNDDDGRDIGAVLEWVESTRTLTEYLEYKEPGNSGWRKAWQATSSSRHWVGAVNENAITGGKASGVSYSASTKSKWNTETYWSIWSAMSGNQRATSPWFLQRASTLSHELSHSLGMYHVNCTGDEAAGGTVNPAYPYQFPNCSLDKVDPAGYYGFYHNPARVKVPVVLSNDPSQPEPNQAFPNMGYQRPRWTPPFKYCQLLIKFGVPCDIGYAYTISPTFAAVGNTSPQRDSVDGILQGTADQIVAKGFLDTQADGGRFSSVFPRPQGTMPEAPLTPTLATDFTLAQVSAAGAVLAQHPLLPGPTISDAEAGIDRAFSEIINRAPGVAKLQLRFGATVLDEVSISATAPTVTLLSPNSGVLQPGTVVTWNAQDADGDALTTHILYSPDDGASDEWRLLASNLREQSSFTIEDISRVPGSNTGRLRVIVDDGFYRAEDRSDGLLTKANAAPLPLITSPRSGEYFGLGDTVYLKATASDPEDGMLGDAALAWGSDIDGTIGSGAEIAVPNLTKGVHDITLTVTDSAGASAATTVRIHFGMPNLLGDCNRDGAADAADISALVLEVFDGDGMDRAFAADGTFGGLPAGCDVNADTAIDAGDISCAVRRLFQGPGACGP